MCDVQMEWFAALVARRTAAMTMCIFSLRMRLG
jgi:hypothetical protein